MTAVEDPDWRALFTHEFAAPAPTAQVRAWATVLGDEYPAELTPHSYTTRTELHRMREELRTGPGQLLVDVGCGRGGPGLWMAAHTGSDYLGVDIAPTALDTVRRGAERLGLADRVRCAEGSFEALPLEDGGADAVLSIDALLFTPDKQAAAHELARALRPGGRLVLTTWDYSGRPPGRPPQVADHRPLLAAAGLDVLAYEETPGWETVQRETGRLLLEAVDEIAAEAGEHPDDVRAGILEMNATIDSMLRRVLVVAERPVTARPARGR